MNCVDPMEILYHGAAGARACSLLVLERGIPYCSTVTRWFAS